MALVALSLLLHAVVFVLLSRSAPPATTAKRPVEMELQWIDVEPPPGPAVTRQPEPRVTKAPSTKRAVAPVASARAEQRDGTPGATQAGGTPDVGLRGDLPLAKGPDLAPGLGFVMRMPEARDGEPSHGATVRNGPGEVIDESVAREYEGEVLTRKMNADLLADVSRAASAVGTVPPHFRRLESAMREKIKTAKIDRAPRSAGETALDVAKVALAPTISAEAARRVADTPLGRSIQMGTVPTPNVEDQRFREGALQMMARTEAIKEAATAPRLRTVLEVTTDASGAVAEVTVLEKSGDREFDESVLHFSRKVARGLPDDDDARGLGTNWWKTRWQFTWEPPEVRVRLLDAQRLPAPQ